VNYYNEHDPKAAAWLRELIRAGVIPAGDVDERDIQKVTADDVRRYTQCHFFAGIGGWSHALQLAGWPESRPVWTGSCPCQPFSSAGKGKAQSDERHLWPDFFRLIRECRPECVFGEQVAAAIGFGWLDGISADLEAEGYAVGAHVLGAHSVGAPHKRQRLYWMADTKSQHDRRRVIGPGRRIESSNGGSIGAAMPDTVAHAERNGGRPNEPRRRAEGREVNGRDIADGWKQVSFAADCLGGDADELGNECSICGLDYGNDCQCPGPTQDGYEYAEIAGILYARALGDSQQPGLERHAGDVNDRHQPGRLNSEPAGQVTAPSRAGAWDHYDILPFRDGKFRRVEAGTFPLAPRVPGRVGLLRGYGNAIVPQVAAEFVKAYLDL